MALKIPGEIKIGFLVVIASALLFWGINYLKGQDWFKDTTPYYIVYEDVEGLEESAEVLVTGFKAGVVSSINYDHKSKGIVVRIDIDKKFQLLLFTSAEIFSADLMGTKAIRLIYGIGKEGIHPVGDTLLPAREPSLQEKVGIEMLPVKLKAEELMLDMQKVLDIIKYIFNESTRENLAKSFESIKITLTNLEHSSVSLDTLLGQGTWKVSRILDNIASISANLKGNNEQLTTIISNFEQISDTLAKAEIKSTFDHARKALTQADEIFTKINKGEGSLGLLLHNDSLYNNLEKAALDVHKLLDDIHKYPNRYVHVSILGKKDPIQKKIYKLEKAKMKCEESPGKCSEEKIDEINKELQKLRGENNLEINDSLKTHSNKSIVFKVQIKSSVSQIPKDSREFRNHYEVEEIFIAGRYKYTIGTYSDFKEAIKVQNRLRNEFPDAFVIAFKDGSPISIGIAKKESL